MEETLLLWVSEADQEFVRKVGRKLWKIFWSN